MDQAQQTPHSAAQAGWEAEVPPETQVFRGLSSRTSPWRRQHPLQGQEICHTELRHPVGHPGGWPGAGTVRTQRGVGHVSCSLGASSPVWGEGWREVAATGMECEADQESARSESTAMSPPVWGQEGHVEGLACPRVSTEHWFSPQAGFWS